MDKWFKIAFRNIVKNKRRSSVTLLAIAMGFAAVSLFRGYTDNTYEGLRQSAIRGEGLGHLTLYKEGWLEKGKINPSNLMFGKSEVQWLIRAAEEDADVMLATPRLHISGLVSNGISSTIFMASGVIPSDERTVRGGWAAIRPVTGEGLSDKKPYGVEVAKDLASLLDLRTGSSGVVMGTTLEGQMNALDMEVVGIYDTGSDATNDKYMRVPYSFAQSLYDTEKADRIVLVLKDWKRAEGVRRRLTDKIASGGLRCEIRTWEELSLFYSKVKGMFDTIFMFLFTIVFIIVVMSVVNTMGMAVVERTREIGTLRVLGLKRRGVGILFSIEGALLGFMGCILGIGLNIVAWLAIRGIKPTYTPPGVSSPVPLVVNLVPETMGILMVFLVGLSLFAAVLPAKRAARQNVVEALGHV